MKITKRFNRFVVIVGFFSIFILTVGGGTWVSISGHDAASQALFGLAATELAVMVAISKDLFEKDAADHDGDVNDDH